MEEIWKKLKKQYKDAMDVLMQDTTSGHGLSERIDWATLNHLSFLRDSIANRPIQSTMGENSSASKASCSLTNNMIELSKQKNTHSLDDFWKTGKALKASVSLFDSVFPKTLPAVDEFATNNLKKKNC